MIIAILPGFARSASMLARWKTLLPGEVRIFDLPGHVDELVIPQPTVAKAADAYAPRIPKDALVIGESLGGLIALELAARGYRAVAVDPPLAPEKLWTLQSALPLILGRNSGQSWLVEFVEAFFGWTADGVSPRNYWPLLDAAAAPVDVIAASLPLWPIRQIEPIPENIPSVLDEIDAYHLARHPKVRFHRVAGPHSLMTDAEDAVRDVLLGVVADAGG